MVLGGATLDAANPAATIFKVAAGTFGYKFFGLLLFAAGMSSVIGSTFTSISFLDYTSRKTKTPTTTATTRWRSRSASLPLRR
ncbi:hypothetical protein QPX96_05610 [Limosilactobacillus fermentum]|nr:hypothetical protein [Limosilactobacillus fermentum]